MSDSVVSVSPDFSAAAAARLLYRHNIGAVPVCSDDGRLRGIVTDRDIVLRCVAAENDPQTTTVREIMTKSTVTVSPDDDVREAAHAMAQAQIRRLPVVRDGKLVGMIALGDMARTREYDMEASSALSEISDNVRRA
jgi:CBS domain-containing protein